VNQVQYMKFNFQILKLIISLLEHGIPQAMKDIFPTVIKLCENAYAVRSAVGTSAMIYYVFM